MKKNVYRQWLRVERQIRTVGASWGAAGGKKKYFDGYMKGAVPLGDYIENLVFGDSSDSDVLVMASPILRRFQGLNWGSFYERDVAKPAVFPIQAQPSIGTGPTGGKGLEGMEPPLQEEEELKAADKARRGKGKKESPPVVTQDQVAAD